MNSRWQTILAVDFDRWATETYRVNFPAVEVRCSPVADCIESLRGADVLIGGPPCQPFSDAGENEGEADDRDCIPDFCAAVERVKPRMFLMENVRGLLKERHIKYFGRVLSRFEEAEYVTQWRLLDAVNFGVPQFRERVFVWGIRRDVYEAGVRHQWPRPTHVWPPPDECMFGSALLPAVTVGQALGIDAAIRRIRGSGVVRRDHPHTEPSPTVMQPTGGKSGLMMVVGGGRNYPEKNADGSWRRDERDITDEPSTTIAASGFALNGGAIPRVHEYRWSDAMLAKHPPASPASTVQAKWFKGGAEGLVEVAADPKHPVHEAGKPANTLTGGGDGHGPNANITALSVDGRTWESRHPIPGADEPIPTSRARSPRDGGRCTENVIREKKLVRRLHPLECGRLQSMPDDFLWPTGISKTAMYRIIGNGVACRMGLVFGEAFSRADPKSQTVIDLFCGGGMGAVGWHGRAWKYQVSEVAQ